MLRTTLRGLLAHSGRLVMSVLTVALSVAFVTGTLMFTDTIARTFNELTASTTADLTVTAGSPDGTETEDAGTLPTEVVQRVLAVPGVEAAHAVVRSERLVVVDRHGRRVGATSGSSVLGLNWLPTKRFPVRLASGRQPRGPGEVVVDGDSAEHSGVGLSDRLRVVTTGGSFDATVVGIAAITTINPGVTLVFFDTPTAQARLLGAPDVFTAVEIDARPSVNHDVLKGRVRAALAAGVPAGVTVETRAEITASAAADLGDTVGFLAVAMLGFAAITPLVGTFLIYNTFTMLIAARTRDVGLLRALGASRTQISRSVLAEALLLGLAGSTLGLLAGAGLALGLMAAMGAFGIDLRGASLLLQAHTPIAAYAVGVLVTLVSAYLPARRAGRIAPMAALRAAGAPPTTTGRLRTVVGALQLAVGIVGLTAAAAQHSGAAFTIGVLASLLALVLLGPVLPRFAIPAMTGAYPRLFGAVGRLSRRNALRNPRRTGATAAALMIGLAVVAGVAVVASSMDTSVQRQIDRALGADFIISTTDLAEPPLGAEVADIVRRVPGVDRVVRTRVGDVVVMAGDDPASTESTWLLGIDPDATGMSPVTYARGTAAGALAPGRIAIGSTYAKDHGLSIGSTVTLSAPNGRTAVLTVGALLAEERSPAAGRRKEKVGDTSRHGSRPTVGIDTLDQLLPGTPDDTLRVSLADGADPRGVAEALRTAVAAYPQAQVRGQAEYKALAGGQFDVLLFMVYGLLALTIVIAILGVVNTLALSVVERTREIGVLGAIGASRTQIRQLVRLESTAIAVYGAMLGLALGLGWGVSAQRVLAEDGVEVLTVPWVTIATVLLGSTVVGLLAAVLPARRAARMNVLSAIAADA